jgi:protein-tyrosine phosphatase
MSKRSDPAGADLAVDFVEVGGGALAVSHRPKVKALPAMRAAGVTHLVTLLSEREGAPAMGAAARRAGIEWVWVAIANARQPEPEDQPAIVAALGTITRLLRDGARVVVHCSAGIHRTGMFAYALLRTAGLDPDEAARALARTRAATAEGVGGHRLGWAEDLAVAARRELDTAPAP